MTSGEEKMSVANGVHGFAAKQQLESRHHQSPSQRNFRRIDLAGILAPGG